MTDRNTIESAGIPFPEASLQAQAGGLRRLAYGILRDEHAAEDAVQETWLAALQRPPTQVDRSPLAGSGARQLGRDRGAADQGGIAAWLSQVTRRQAWRSQRSRRRRLIREQAVARREDQDVDRAGSVVGDVVRQEVLRDVLDTVLGLPEPYQTVVLQRYFEDLTPLAIAERSATKLATVESRLHRARVLLRERLDARYGEGRCAWAPALALWTGWLGKVSESAPLLTAQAVKGSRRAGISGSATIAKAALVGGILMQGKLLVGAGLFMLACLAVYLGSEGSPRPGGASPQTNSATQSADVSDLLLGPVGESAQVRTPETDPGELESIASAQYAHQLSFSGVVLDQEDRPLIEATLWIAQAGHPWNVAAKTGWDGRFSVGINCSRPTAEIIAFVEHPLVNEEGFYSFQISERERPIRLGLRGSSTWNVAYSSAIRLVDSGAGEDSYAYAIDEVAGRQRAFQPRSTSLVATERGSFFAWDQISAPRESIVLAQQLAEYIALQDTRETLNRSLALVSLPSPGAALDPPPMNPEFPAPGDAIRRTITGVVSHADGALAADASVSAIYRREVQSVRTDDQGVFTLSLPMSALDIQLQAGGSPYGIAHKSLRLGSADEQQSVEWSPMLNRGRELCGQIHGLNGEGSDEEEVWVVDYVADGGNWIDTATVAKDGRFCLPNLPALGGQLFVRPDGVGVVSHVVDSVGAEEGYLEIALSPEARATGLASLALVDADGQALPDAEARAHQASTGRGVWFKTNSQGRLSRAFPPGSFDVELGTDRVGYIDLAPLWVQGVGLHEMGDFPAPMLQEVELKSTEGPVRLMRTDLSFPSLLGAGDAQSFEGIPLPSGSYQFNPFVSEPAAVDAQGSAARRLALERLPTGMPSLAR